MPKTKVMQDLMRVFEYHPTTQAMREMGMKDDEIITSLCEGQLDLESLNTKVELN